MNITVTPYHVLCVLQVTAGQLANYIANGGHDTEVIGKALSELQAYNETLKQVSQKAAA